MPKTILVLATFFACLLSTAATTPGIASAEMEKKKSPEEQALDLQSMYKSLNSLTFSFDQITRTGTRERRGHGESMFYRFKPVSEVGQGNTPVIQSVMRWNYTEPDPQIIVSDGETLSIYTEKDKQLIRTPAKELESDITYAFFAGTRNLLDDFVARPAESNFVYTSEKKLQTLMLVPRQPHNQIRDVQVWFDSHGLIHHLRIADHFESVTELNFDNIKVNSLPASNRTTLEEIISFPVPPGTEIISR